MTFRLRECESGGLELVAPNELQYLPVPSGF